MPATALISHGYRWNVDVVAVIAVGLPPGPARRRKSTAKATHQKEHGHA